jgi:hypothetical protein
VTIATEAAENDYQVTIRLHPLVDRGNQTRKVSC